MDIEEYKTKVIEWFKSGKATAKQYDEMALAVLNASETNSFNTMYIDLAIGLTTFEDYSV